MADATLDVATLPATAAHIEYLLHLADNALVLGQRNAEWCGHGPVLEEDIAMANISVDLIGQARMLYQHAATLDPKGAFLRGIKALQDHASPVTEDTLAYFRGAPDFRNFTLLELPHSVTVGGQAGDSGGARDYAVTLVRNFIYSALMVLRWDALRQSTDAQLAAIAERSVKETRYHLRHSRDWLVRLGDGTPESHAKTQAAWDHLMPYTQEFWTVSAIENEMSGQGIGIAAASLRNDWQVLVSDAAREATLNWPLVNLVPGASAAQAAPLPQGKHGDHSSHLAPLLAEMQSLARQHPGAVW
jgi:ring-1,2-phenylacetyl-CoA epoxidase subunit PaaC